MIIHYFRKPCLSSTEAVRLRGRYEELSSRKLGAIESEYCFNVSIDGELTDEERQTLLYLLTETFEPDFVSKTSFLAVDESKTAPVIEVGPRMNFTTAWSSNAVAVCQGAHLPKVKRIERSRRYKLNLATTHDAPLTPGDLEQFASLVHDRMTECVYAHPPLTTFESGVKPKPVYTIPLLEKGSAALIEVSDELGLGFDEQDLAFYTELFVTKLKRNPTSVECFDLAQGNSEHSRHWFFGGKMVVDGKALPHTLFQMVKAPFKANPNNSVIAFHDNSSAQRGFPMRTLLPKAPGLASPMIERACDYDFTLTAETHNFPTGICPFPGAETGPGGRIRDGQSTGRGSLIVAGMAGYCVGNLQIPGYKLPWESESFSYPDNMASPLKIIIDASNGASDYGNKFGEPMIQGFTRSFGLNLSPEGDATSQQRREWIKPIMFSSGLGQISHAHLEKGFAEKGLLVVKIGGPAYRIGLGGGAASSMVQGDNKAELDFNAVQRGDAEMEQKLNRVIRTCVELGDDNPIISIHDQGAGGSGNVLKEISEPSGANIEIRKLISGDETLSVLELYGAEYQENDALLLAPESLDNFTRVCNREKSPFAVVGEISGTGRIVVHDSWDDSTPVDLDLKQVLTDIPQKTFDIKSQPLLSNALNLPASLSVNDALERVLKLLSVGSKRFLMTKVDRCVTGLIAQQQCVGPLHTPLADVAVTAQSHFGVTGCATAIGEQPLKGLVDPEAMGRLAVAESLTNLMWAKISSLRHVKASGNWMWPAKEAGEGKFMYDACRSLSDFMLELEIAIDGGKDSLSMATRVPNKDFPSGQETVKCPGSLVISSYASCPDITLTVTPDLKLPGQSSLFFVEIGSGQRLGGSALAQVYSQVGDSSPDVSASALRSAFNAIQELVGVRALAAGHDRSDGGLLTTVIEMAFAGNCGINVDIVTADLSNADDAKADPVDPVAFLFNEEPGAVVEVARHNRTLVEECFKRFGVKYALIGQTTVKQRIKVSVDSRVHVDRSMTELRDIWEATSFELEKLQCDPECVRQEQEGLSKRKCPPYKLTYTPEATPDSYLLASERPKVAIVRQEGSNGDREMASAFHLAGFEAWDVTMTDLMAKPEMLQSFRGIAFVGGFSFADVFDSSKGWAATVLFNKRLSEEFNVFYGRRDTFSLGVCNGCQLMALLGWIPKTSETIPREKQPRFIHNKSGRFECRFTTVQIQESPAIMLGGDMVGSTLGVWSAHGEGQAFFPDEEVFTSVAQNNLIPLKYVDDENSPTERYPFNPNGSRAGVAALCSPDGRHLAMMPHPERSTLPWQLPYTPTEWTMGPSGTEGGLRASPWLQMFQNAREWCARVPSQAQ